MNTKSQKSVLQDPEQTLLTGEQGVRDGRKFMVSADRSSPSRRVRYVEGSQPAAENCKVCQVAT